MVANTAIPCEATAEGRSAQIERDGGEHMHSYQRNPTEWEWRAVDWKLRSEICETRRCWRRRLKAGTLREAVESEA